MKDFFLRLDKFLCAEATRTSVSIAEYFVCGWLALTGVQSIVGWIFGGKFTANLDHPEMLLIAGLVFIVTGVLFMVIKIKNWLRAHEWMLQWVYFMFLFASIAEIIIIPTAVGLWVGALLLTALTGLFYLRFRYLSFRSK